MATNTAPRPKGAYTVKTRDDGLQIEPGLAAVHRIMTLYHCTCEKQQWQCILIRCGKPIGKKQIRRDLISFSCGTAGKMHKAKKGSQQDKRLIHKFNARIDTDGEQVD